MGGDKMKKVLGLLLLTSLIWGQILYEEHFTGGTTDLEWSGFFTDEDTFIVVQDTSTPEGDNWAGILYGTPFGLAYAGDISLQDISIEAWIYVIVTQGSGGPYNGVAVRVNPAFGDFYVFSADLDSDRRLRLTYHSDSTFMPVYIHVWEESSIPGGLPQEDGWHKMKLKIIGDSLWAYFDGQELPGCPFIHSNSSGFGFFGIYSTIFSGVAETKADSIVVLSEPVQINESGGGSIPQIKIYQLRPREILFEFRTENPGDILLYNVAGRFIKRIVLQKFEDTYRGLWRGRDRFGREVGRGVYIYKIEKMGNSGKLILY